MCFCLRLTIDKDVESDDDSVDSISPTDSLEVHFQGEAANLELPLRDGLFAGMETEDGLSIPVPTHLTHSLSTMSLDSLVVAPTADKVELDERKRKVHRQAEEHRQTETLTGTHT